MFQVSAGLATLDPDAVQVIRLLERRIAGWGREIGAREYSYPPLLPVEELSRIDYFENFPHLGTLASVLRPDRLAAGYASHDTPRVDVPNADLEDARFALPSAACYGVYFSLRGSTLSSPSYVSTLARCFRNERKYAGLRRLWGFQMRELVVLGDAEAVQEHLRSFRTRIEAFAERVGLPVKVAVATDPFFDKSTSRARMQELFPVKEEFVYDDDLAIASLNFHRNFFGERCEIRTADGSAAFSGCVAFGLERWLAALADHLDGRVERITGVLESA
jgi:seryl-tRNA synthetase